jgi:hypothetical protein
VAKSGAKSGTRSTIKSGGNNYTIIKENEASRTFQKAIIENGKVKIVSMSHERMVDGDYGN